MSSVTEPLREEHRDLLPRIEAIRSAGDAIGLASPEEERRLVDETYEFLTHHLLPHAYAEEVALYPAVARLMGTERATATMSRDHLEVERLVRELGDLRRRMAEGVAPASLQSDLRRVLYGLHTLIKVHFAKEEGVYLPILDEGMPPEDARSVFEAMDRAAKEAKARASAS